MRYIGVLSRSVLPNCGCDGGLSVGKRIGNAVMRNKVKRYLRQSLQDLEHEIPHEYDYLLIARPDIKDKDQATVRQSLRHVMTVAKLLSSHS